MSAPAKKKGKSTLDILEGFGVNGGIVLSILGLCLIGFIVLYIGIPTTQWISFVFLSSPLWLPWVLFHEFFKKWMEYVGMSFALAQGRTTLEIQFPQEVFKSPLAMELVLNQMYQTASPDNHIETYWDGKHPPTYGLEIVSDGGRIHFYINTPKKKFKNLIETQLYAQYPGIVVKELPIDYTAALPWDPSRFGYFALHFRLKNPDPFPIKTYIDFGLDKDQKEEYKIDPMSTILELLGSIGPKEKIWIQILISAHRKVNFKTGSLQEHDDWQGAITAEIDKIMKKRAGKKKKPSGEEEEELSGTLTPRERDIVASLERSAAKNAFNTKIRALYAAELEGLQISERIGPIITMWRSFDDVTRNGIGVAWRSDFDWNWWQDPSGKKRAAHKERELEEYKLRIYEGQAAKGIDGGFILTTEELASIFHPAGAVLLTPTLERVPSARAEAPSNLPRGI